MLHDVGKPKTKMIRKGRVSFPRHAEESAEIARSVMKRLKFSNEEIDEVTKLIRYHMVLYTYAIDKTRGIMNFIRALTNDGRYMNRINELEELMIADAVATGT